ncbi:MAG: hypothetical protein AAF511_07255, partial [Pseudomonadota bacterium]
KDAAREGLISELLASRIINDAGGEPLTVFAAALNVSEKGFAKLLSERPGSRIGLPALSGKDRKRLEKVFQNLGPAAAGAILSYWDIDLSEEGLDKPSATTDGDMASIEQRLRDAFDTDDKNQNTASDALTDAQDTDETPHSARG